MGAIVGEESVTFRVWAPNANKIFVAGDFNDWNKEKDALESEENGYWSGVLPEAKAGDEYKYATHNGDHMLERNDPYAHETTNSNGNSIVTPLKFEWEDEGFTIPHWNSLDIYELHVGTFNRHEPDQVGTFDDVIAELPYLQSLGINAIELLPVAEFAGGISWGYNPACPFAIERDYGGPEALARLVNEAHKAGIAIIMDVVYNHSGHPITICGALMDGVKMVKEVSTSITTREPPHRGAKIDLIMVESR